MALGVLVAARSAAGVTLMAGKPAMRNRARKQPARGRAAIFRERFRLFIILVFQFNFFFNARAVWPTVDQCGIPGPKAQIILQKSEAGGRRADTQTDSAIAIRLFGADPNIAS